MTKNSANSHGQSGTNKRVAILFTDIKGSTAFYKTHGNLAGRIMIQKLNDMLFPIVQAYRGVVVKTIGDSIMAYFLAPGEALWASVAIQKRLKKHNAEHSPSDHLLIKISMNYGDAIIEEKDVFGDVVNIAGKLVTCCDARQIIITESFYEETKDSPDIHFVACDIKEKTEQAANIKVFLVDWDKPEKQKHLFTPIVPYESKTPDETPCFYCGTTRHPMSGCPSKLLRKPTNFLERLGYLPVIEIRRLFQERFHDIVKPLKRGSDEERFEILFKEDREDPYSLCFFSFYETTEIFQLRSTHQLFLENRVDKVELPDKTGSLLMGEDCLRVSKLDEAKAWFEKAVKEQVDNYRPQVAMGILAMEKSNPEQALSYFNSALSFSISNFMKRHIYLLIARLYEVSGSLSYAQKEIEKAIALFHDWNEARYYLAVILAKSGKIKPAVEIFRHLMSQSPRYCLMISLDPELSREQGEIIPLLNSEMLNIRTRAETSLNNIKNIIEKHEGWFSRDDMDFSTALKLFGEASDSFEKESLSGLVDIPGFEVNINLLIKRAVNYRQGYLKKKISGFASRLANNSKYLARFPYKNMLSKRNFRIIDNFEKQLREAKQVSETVPPPSLKETKIMLERLSRESEKIASSQSRLEIIKNIVFALECSLKTVGFYFITAAITMFSFTSLLLLYQGYENSFSSITKTHFVNYLKFGFFAGLLTGLFASAVWLKKNIGKMHKKIEN